MTSPAVRLAHALLLGLGACLVVSLGACRPKVSPHTASGVVIPNHLTRPEEQLDYLVEHYWDRLQIWPDVPAAELRQQTEDYCDFIVGLPQRQVRPSLCRGLDALSVASLREVLPVYREKLYSEGSPSYDEALYGEVLRWVSRSPKLDSLTRSQAVVELQRLRHNAPGTIAQDFRYHLSDSVSHRLREFSAPYTLLLLVRDSSSQLRRWQHQLAQAPALRGLIRQGQLRPLVVYTGASRPDSVARTLLPEETTWAYDSAGLIAGQRRYATEQGSGLYLLDREKRVLLKNATISQVNQTLRHDEK